MMSLKSKINMVKFYYKRNGFIKTFKKVKYKLFHILSNRKKYKNDIEDYQLWIKNNEPSAEEIEEQRKKKFEYEPKISIVVPMYNTKEEFLKELIDSILQQTYVNWELCLADGSPQKKEYVDKYVSQSEKIIYRFLDDNKGISGNTNCAIEMATGEYIAFLDHDDILPIFSLYEIVDCINNNKDADFIYTDEDKIFNGKRIEPHFKSDYAPDMLMSYNYICHFAIYRKDLIKKIGLLDSNFDGSQDYDFILRATENASKIMHIPKILYHWRMNEDSVALNSSAKPYAYEAAKRAIKAHLDRIGVDADVEDSETAGIYKVKYKITGNPKVSIIISSNGDIRLLNKCLKSVFKRTNYSNIEIIIVACDGIDKIKKYYEAIKKDNRIKLTNNDKKICKHSRAINIGVGNSDGEYMVFLDSSMKIISNDWIETLLGNCQRKDVGIVGAKIIYNNSKIEHVGIILDDSKIAINVNENTNINEAGYMARNNIIQNYNVISNKLMMISRDNYNEMNGFDESLSNLCSNIDFCLKIRNNGKQVVMNPLTVAKDKKIRKIKTENFKDIRHSENFEVFEERWAKIYKSNDIYYSPNFEKDKCVFKIKI